MLKTLLSIPPVVIDGVLYSMIALFGAQQAILTGEEAYKYIDPKTLFWLKFWIISLAAFCGAMKMFRSTSYAAHLQRKSDESKDVSIVSTSTETVKKTEEKPPSPESKTTT